MPRHHTIDYIEFTVRDMALSQRFYTSVFGWTFTDYGPGYAGIVAPDGGKEVGGFAVGEPNVGGPLVVLYSDDLDATLAAVEAGGGVVTKAPFAFPGGRRFHFADPSGNALAVWTQSQA